MSGATQRLVGAVLLAGYVLAVGLSGFAWPVGKGDLALWPFNRAWWMFHREDGFYYHLRFFVLYHDGRRDEVEVDRWFTWPGSESTLRYDEVPRDRDTLRALVAYVCLRHNREAPVLDHWRAVTVTDTAWRQARGRRVPLRDVAYSEKTETEKLFEEPCPEGAR